MYFFEYEISTFALCICSKQDQIIMYNCKIFRTNCPLNLVIYVQIEIDLRLCRSSKSITILHVGMSWKGMAIYY